MNSIHYELSIVEHENGWRVTADIFQGWALSQVHLGGVDPITFNTRKEAFEYAEVTLATLARQKVEGAHK